MESQKEANLHEVYEKAPLAEFCLRANGEEVAKGIDRAICHQHNCSHRANNHANPEALDSARHDIQKEIAGKRRPGKSGGQPALPAYTRIDIGQVCRLLNFHSVELRLKYTRSFEPHIEFCVISSHFL